MVFKEAQQHSVLLLSITKDTPPPKKKKDWAFFSLCRKEEHYSARWIYAKFCYIAWTRGEESKYKISRCEWNKIFRIGWVIKRRASSA